MLSDTFSTDHLNYYVNDAVKAASKFVTALNWRRDFE